MAKNSKTFMAERNTQPKFSKVFKKIHFRQEFKIKINFQTLNHPIKKYTKN